MSFGERQARSFFEPLVGKSVTFLLQGRKVNLEFAAGTAALAASAGYSCAILDLDALYSSNADKTLGPLAEVARPSTIRIPAPGSDIETEFSKLFETDQEVVVIDSLNSLLHLLSREDGSSRSRKLAFCMASLSYFARTGHKVVMLSAYEREGLARSPTGRSMSSLSDVTASVKMGNGALEIMIERGSAWPGGWFSTRTP